MFMTEEERFEKYGTPPPVPFNEVLTKEEIAEEMARGE